jgi:hypothetical protein
MCNLHKLHTFPFPLLLSDNAVANNTFRQSIKLRVNNCTSTVPVLIAMALHNDTQKSLKNIKYKVVQI